VPRDFGVPAAFGRVVAEGGGVGELGLEGGDEFGGRDEVVVLLADVGVWACFGGQLPGAVSRRAVPAAYAEPGCDAPVRGSLRFVFYGRVSTEDWQDPESSRARQREQAGALVRGHGGVIVAELFDVGQSRAVAWGRRTQAAALIAQLADPYRGWDAIVVGEYERAFYGAHYAMMAPLFEHYRV
jgi:hypothetical protein